MRYTIGVAMILGVIFIAAVCTPQQAHDYLSDGTDHVFQQRQSVDFVLVLDRSGSMRGEKIEQAKDAAQVLVHQLSRGDRAAIVAFDDDPRVISGFSDDPGALSAAIDTIVPGDFTRYQPALEQAHGLFNGNRRVIVLLSDGKPDDDQEQLLSTVDDILAEDVCIFTIAYADTADEQAQQVLRGISDESQRLTGCGDYFRAGENTFELSTAFDEIYERVSSDALLDIEATVHAGDPVRFEVSATSTLNEADIIGQACFAPNIGYQVIRNKEVVHEETTQQATHSVSLPAGEYEYLITVEETCGGDCLFTGRTDGTFTLSPGESACSTPWDELTVLLTNNEYIEVQITPEGFSPQTVGTEGIVVWRNLDDVPRRIRSPDGSFVSPYIQPGESWSKVFPAGVYSYVDATSGYTGIVKNEHVPAHLPTDLVLVLDKSGSMAGAPLSSAKMAAQNLLAILTPSDRTSLIVFSDRARVVQPLTSSNALLQDAVQGVLSEGSTFYIDPIRAAGQQLDRSSSMRKQVVIFLSDGAPFDPGGKDAILAAVGEEFDSACLYTIGYGEQGVGAVDLLSSMADFVQDKNGCGEFYFSTADKTELSTVFGEIYARTQEPGLQIENVSIPSDPGETFTMRTRVRSSMNGLAVPSVSEFGCIPPAEVIAVFGEKRFPLSYNGREYVGNVTLPPGEHRGTVLARLSAPDEPARVVLGSVPVTVRVSGTEWILWSLMTGGLLLIAYIFIRRRNTFSYDL